MSLPPLLESLKVKDLKGPWLDSVESTLPVMSRMDIHKLLMSLKQESEDCKNLMVPVTDLLVNSVTKERQSEKFIIKSNAACGVSFSHKMIIANTCAEEQLYKVLEICYGKLRDLVVQDYVDHDGYEMKVYCIGDAIHISKRKIPKGTGKEHLPPFTVFDSLETKSRNPDEMNYPLEDKDETILRGCAKWLRAKLGLTLFGFDALKVIGTGQIAIIDINYFPSFKGIPDAHSNLRGLCKLKKEMRF